MPNIFTAHARGLRGPGVDQSYVDGMGLKSANYLGATAPVLRNLFDKDKATPDTGINGDTGVIYPADDISLTGAIPVGGLPSVTASVDLYKYAFFNFAGEFVGGDDGLGTVLIDAGDPLSIPDGSFYLKFDTPTAFIPGLMVVPGIALPTRYIAFGAADSEPWAGKTLGFVGDSISAVHVYQPIVASLLQADFHQFTNDGFSGRKMGEAVPVLTGGNLGTLDLLSVFLGTNDFGGNTPLGAHGDATGAGTFYGNTRNVIETALTTNLDMQMMMVTPMKRGVVSGMPAWDDSNTAGHVLEDYVEAIIRVAADYAVPVLDLFRLSNLNDLTLSTYASDLLHPSTMQAWNMIARKFAAFIRSI